MECDGGGATEEGVCLLPELRLRVLSLLPPNSLALGGRLSSKNAAQHFTELSCRKSHLRQPLPDYAISASLDSAQSALRQLTFRQKLHLPATAAASGCEANVDFALQLLQPHVFSEVLRTDSGYTWAYEGPSSSQLPPTADVGSAAVASGLGHLLPSLEQRCPGLLDPGRTLEAAARHCDLAGLQAAWEAVGQRLLRSIREMKRVEPKDHYYAFDEGDPEVLAESDLVWRRMVREATGSSTPDAIAKMDWVREKSKQYVNAGASAFCNPSAYVCDASVWSGAAASGDWERMWWLSQRTVNVLPALLQHASLGFLQDMEQYHHLVPPAHHDVWGAHDLDRMVAGSAVDSAAKLRWLEARRSPIGFQEAVKAAAAAGNLEALQLVLEKRQQHQLLAEEERGLGLELGLDSEMDPVEWATSGGHVSTAAWLVQAGWPLTPEERGLGLELGLDSEMDPVEWATSGGTCPQRHGWCRPDGR